MELAPPVGLIGLESYPPVLLYDALQAAMQFNKYRQSAI